MITEKKYASTNGQIHLNQMISSSDYLPGMAFWRDAYELKFFIAGSVEVYCEGQTYRLKAGDILCVNPYETCSLCYLSGEPRYHSFILPAIDAESKLQDEFLQAFSEKRLIFRTVIQDDLIRRAADCLSCETEGTPFYSLSSHGLFLEIIAALMRRHITAVLPVSRQKYTRRLLPAMEHMQKHYEQPVTLELLATLCDMSVKYFCKLFKQANGKTAMQYLNEIRLNKACVLLRTTSQSMTEIALSVGFTDQCYFSRCFKVGKGVSPSQYRRK